RSTRQPRTAPQLVRRSPARTARSTGRATAGASAGPRPRAPPRARRATAVRAVSPSGLRSRLRGRRLSRCVLEPVRPALALPADGVEIRLLHRERHRAGRADLMVVDL